MSEIDVVSLKEKGNQQFKLRNFEEAKNFYSDAIFNLEIQTAESSFESSQEQQILTDTENSDTKSSQENPEDGNPINHDNAKELHENIINNTEAPKEEKTPERELTPEQKAANYLKATLYANRSACYKELGDVENCLTDADHAIALHTPYPKVRMRRFWALRQKGKANDALAEIKKAIEEDPQIEQEYRDEYRDVQKEAEIENERLKQEALGTLKDLGNKFLGLFGMSLDNFQMQQNPEGGYNIQFKQ